MVRYPDGEVRVRGGDEDSEAQERAYHEERIRQLKNDCREILGDERFLKFDSMLKWLSENRRLPEDCDWGYIYEAITLGEQTRRGDEMIPGSAWCNRRDKAIQAVGTAIQKLKKVFREHPANDRANVEALAEGLELEYENLIAPYSSGRPGPIDWAANARANLIRKDRAMMGWANARGGRPSPVWRHQTVALLRRPEYTGLTKDAAETLVEEAGLWS